MRGTRIRNKVNIEKRTSGNVPDRVQELRQLRAWPLGPIRRLIEGICNDIKRDV